MKTKHVAVAALALWSCSEARTSNLLDLPGVKDGAVRDAAVQAEQPAALKTQASGLYVVAELGGGEAVNANRRERGPWETFTLVDLDGAPLRAGDRVQLRTHDGAHWLSADGGGGAGLHAKATAGGPWETFSLVRLDGDGEVKDGDRVGLSTDNGRFVVAEEGGGGVVNADRTALGPWETFLLELGAGSPPLPPPPPGGDGEVRADDTVLVLPSPGGAVLGTVTGYELNDRCPFADTSKCELPLYTRYDRDDPEWWDVLVEELLASRVNVVMVHGRGCLSADSGDQGNGNMCPRLLRHLVAAIDRAGARGALRLGMFDDTGAYQGTRNLVEGRPWEERFDLADRTSWRFFWDHNMKIWFDTVPKELWYRLDGRPVVAFWTLSSSFFANQQGNGSALLRELRAKFLERYGEDPIFICDSTWANDDPTLTPAEAQGLNDWFDPNRGVSTYHSWGGQKWGATVPSYRDPDTRPGCGAACREQLRRHGAALREAFEAGRDARFTLLEGWTNVVESAGFYRSDAWDYPNQYINLVREYADPELPTLRLEAESADVALDASPENRGGKLRPGPIDVGRLAEPSGWFVGWTEPGEALTFKELSLPCGTYRLTARVAAPGGSGNLHVELGGQVLSPRAVEASEANDYRLVHLGEVRLSAQRTEVRVVFDTGGLNLDWVFLKRADTRCP